MSSATPGFDQVQEAFRAARRMEGPERGRYLRGLASESVRREVEALLENHEARFLDTPALGSRFSVAPPPTSTSRADPRSLGAYEIEGRIGEGGMGVVYRATHRTTGRRVALKVIRSPVAGGETLQRFAIEARLLGRLKHPGIAQVYDAGVDDERTPFIAMEAVKGVPLDRFVETRGLGIDERVRLLLKVCDAVEHAHQRGVIHRDLKPSNILIETAPGGEPRPKIVDFGVARAIDDDGRTSVRPTSDGQFLGTLGYTSPEQIAGDVAEVDTRADVYALGVILYETLTGRLPFAIETRNVVGLARLMESHDPLRPSAADAAVPRDLDAICLKALARDKVGRYQSVPDLASDLRRFLRHEPVLARQAGALYLLSRFTRRHRALVAGAGVAAVFLILGVTATSWQAVRATRASGRARDAEERAAARARLAERKADEAERTIDYLSSLLLAPVRGGRETTVVELIEHVARNVGETFADTPHAEVAIRSQICATYRHLGRLAAAAEQGELAVAIAQRRLEPAGVRATRAMRELALTRLEQGDAPGTEAVVREIIEVRGRAGRRTDLMDLTTLSKALREQARTDEAEAMLSAALGEDDDPVDVGEIHAAVELARLWEIQGRIESAEAMLSSIAAESRSELGAGAPAALFAGNALGSFFTRRGRFAEAEAVVHDVLHRRLRALGDGHRATLVSMNNLAVALDGLGRHDEAALLYRRALRGRRRLLGDGHRRTVTTMANLARTMVSRGRIAEATPLLDEIVRHAPGAVSADVASSRAVAMTCAGALQSAGRNEDAEVFVHPVYQRRLELYGERHRATLDSMALLAKILDARGRAREGATLRRRCLKLRRKELGDDDPDTLASWHDEATALALAGRLGEATKALSGVLERRRRVLGENHPQTLNSAVNLAYLLKDGRALDDAAQLFLSVNEAASESPLPLVTTVACRQGLALTYDLMNRKDDAERLLRALLPEAEAAFGADHSRVVTIRAQLGANLAHRSPPRAEGLALLRDVAERRRELLGPEHPKTLTAGHNLAAALAHAGFDDEAETAYREVLDLRERTHGRTHRKTLFTRFMLADHLAGRGRPGAAADILAAVIERVRAQVADDDWFKWAFLALHASSLADAGHPAEALPLLEQAHARLAALLGPDHWRSKSAATRVEAARRRVAGEQP